MASVSPVVWVQANAQMLDRLLSEIKSKLELLGRSDDCPGEWDVVDEKSTLSMPCIVTV